MKHIYFSFILFLFFVQQSSAQFYTQYFDGADTAFASSVNVFRDTSSSNIWQIGAPHKIIFNSAATVPNVIVTDTMNNYPVNNTSRFTVEVLDQFGFNGIFALQWKQKLNMTKKHAGGIVEFTTDHGVTWQNVFNNSNVFNFYGFLPANKDTLLTGEYAFSGTDSTWKDIWLCLQLTWIHSLPDTIMFRFTFTSDTLSDEKEGWMIDNMLAHRTIIHPVNGPEEAGFLDIYPNPSTNVVYIQTEKRMENYTVESMELINETGQVVERWKNLPLRFSFETGKYPDGLYLLKVKTTVKSESIPLMICKH